MPRARGSRLPRHAGSLAASTRCTTSAKPRPRSRGRDVGRQHAQVRHEARDVGHGHRQRKVFEHQLVVGRVADVQPRRGIEAQAEREFHGPACAAPLVVRADPAVDVDRADARAAGHAHASRRARPRSAQRRDARTRCGRWRCRSDGRRCRVPGGRRALPPARLARTAAGAGSWRARVASSCAKSRRRASPSRRSMTAPFSATMAATGQAMAKGSLHPAGRPVMAITGSCACARRCSAASAAGSMAPSCVSVSSMSVSTPRSERSPDAGSCCSGCIRSALMHRVSHSTRDGMACLDVAQ